jgi:hypothetical protein
VLARGPDGGGESLVDAGTRNPFEEGYRFDVIRLREEVDDARARNAIANFTETTDVARETVWIA